MKRERKKELGKINPSNPSSSDENNVGENKKAFGFSTSTYPTLYPALEEYKHCYGLCDICHELRAFRHYEEYHVCTVCFIDCTELEQRDEKEAKKYMDTIKEERWKNTSYDHNKEIQES